MYTNNIDIVAQFGITNSTNDTISHFANHPEEVSATADNYYLPENFMFGEFHIYRNGQEVLWWDTRSFPYCAVWWLDNYRELVSDQVVLLRALEEDLVFRCSPKHITLQIVTGSPTWNEWEPYRDKTLMEQESFVFRRDAHHSMPMQCRVADEVCISQYDWFRSMFTFASDYRKLLSSIKSEVYKQAGNLFYEDDVQVLEDAYAFCRRCPERLAEIEAFMRDNNIG